jgi:ABC-type molybdate transport system permease subunit
VTNAPLALVSWLVAESSPLFAGFVGGVIAQAVVMLASRGKSEVPREVRIQIVLIWIVIGGLLLVNINQGQNIQQLLETR